MMSLRRERFLSPHTPALNGGIARRANPALVALGGLFRWMIRDEARACNGRSGDCDRRHIGHCSWKLIGALAKSKFI
jgi:hypothetical protein